MTTAFLIVHSPSFTRRNEAPPSRWSSRIAAFVRPTVLLALIVVVVYGPTVGRIGWLCDDHWQVYGNDGRAVPTLGEALRQGGRGFLSPCRMLNLPFVGYPPLWLGSAGCHRLTAILHLCNAALFYGVLRRLHWPESRSTIAAVVFATSPWITQATMWWSASPAVVATSLFLLGVELHLCSEAGGGKGRLLLAASASLLFVQLLFYELWLAGVILLAAIERRRRRSVCECAARLGPAFLATAFYGVWYLLAHQAEVNQPRGSWERLPIVFASLHLRCVAWLTHTPWRAALAQAWAAPTLWLVLLGALTVFFVGRRLAAEAVERPASGSSLWSDAALAYAWFLASRLVLLLKGSTTISTRLNYGAAMAGAMAAALLLEALGRTRIGRRVVAFLAAGLVGGLALTTMGTAKLYERSSVCEAHAFETLARIAPRATEATAYLLVGSPIDGAFEDSPYCQLDGFWLHCRVREIRPDAVVYAVDRVELSGDAVRFNAYHRTLLRRCAVSTPRDRTLTFDWGGPGGALRRVPVEWISKEAKP